MRIQVDLEIDQTVVLSAFDLVKVLITRGSAIILTVMGIVSSQTPLG
ncbi:hypothetical protein AB4379_12130 [Vibrio breoganii]